MHTNIPVRLGKEPLLEAIWEIRFSDASPSVTDLLPGMLFKAFPEKYLKAVKLPAASIPAPLADHDPGLQFAPKIRLEGGKQSVQVGDRVVSLSCRRPYPGWERFSADIRELAEGVEDTGLIERLDRFSLKYIDLIELESPIGLEQLQLELRLGKYDLAAKPVHLRTEIKDNDFIHIVQIMSPAEVRLTDVDSRLKGVLVDIDSIMPLTDEDSWAALHQGLDAVHASCKNIFFSILKQETIEKLEPKYGE